jgi:hypothetical protein
MDTMAAVSRKTRGVHRSVSTTAKKVNKVHIETGLAVEDDKWPIICSDVYNPIMRFRAVLIAAVSMLLGPVLCEVPAEELVTFRASEHTVSRSMGGRGRAGCACCHRAYGGMNTQVVDEFGIGEMSTYLVHGPQRPTCQIERCLTSH